MAFDYVFDELQNPKIVEFSYGFRAPGYDKCEGYWDKNMNWNEGSFNFCGWMIEGLLNDINKYKNGKQSSGSHYDAGL